MAIYGKDATVLSLGDPTHEGGDIVIYDRWGGVQFQADADATLIEQDALKLGHHIQLGYKGYRTKNMALFERQATPATTYLEIMDYYFLFYRGLKLSELQCSSITSYVTNWSISARDTIGGNLSFVTPYPTSKTVAQAIDGRFDVPYAGDITINDDRFIKIGKDSDGTLPTPSEAYRGKMIRVEDEVTWLRDFLYICTKRAGVYDWREILSKDWMQNIDVDLISPHGLNLGSATYPFGGLYVWYIEAPTEAAGEIYIYTSLMPVGGYDLGSLSYQWRDLHLDGWAYIDSLRVDVALDLDNIDINATSVATVTAVIPVTAEGVTRYIALYESYS